VSTLKKQLALVLDW